LEQEATYLLTDGRYANLNAWNSFDC